MNKALYSAGVGLWAALLVMMTISSLLGSQGHERGSEFSYYCAVLLFNIAFLVNVILGFRIRKEILDEIKRNPSAIIIYMMGFMFISFFLYRKIGEHRGA
jgi:uncharacterized protein YneF (UPF0154 family)